VIVMPSAADAAWDQRGTSGLAPSPTQTAPFLVPVLSGVALALLACACVVANALYAQSITLNSRSKGNRPADQPQQSGTLRSLGSIPAAFDSPARSSSCEQESLLADMPTPSTCSQSARSIVAAVSICSRHLACAKFLRSADSVRNNIRHSQEAWTFATPLNWQARLRVTPVSVGRQKIR